MNNMFSPEKLQTAVDILKHDIPAAIFETLYVTLIATFFAFVIGLPLGVLLVVGDKGGVLPLPKWLMKLLNVIVNLLRSVPFIILIVVVFPLTRLIVGTTIGSVASIVPLVIAAFPFVARLVESSLREVNPNIIEAAQSMGATPFQIITKVMIPESVPSLVSNATIAVTTILGYTAMSGAIGGGGLIAGVAYTIKQINPNCKVYGVQAAGAPSMKNSVADGKIETLKNVQTIADGIAVKTPGTNTFELIKKYVDGIYTVSDDEIALAILTLMEQQKLVSEGAGAVPVAAVMNGKIPDIEGKKVCCLVSGGNIDVTILSRVIERGLKMGGRSASITIALSDKPGQLLGVSKIVADNGANVVSVNYDSTDLDMNITDCYLKLGIETRNYQHIVQIKNALKDAGFEVCD